MTTDEQVWHVELRDDGREVQACLYKGFRLEIRASSVIGKREAGFERTFMYYFNEKLLDGYTLAWVAGAEVPVGGREMLIDHADRLSRTARWQRWRAHGGGIVP